MRERIWRGLNWLGFGLLVATSLAWFLTFPTLQLLAYSFGGDRNLFRPASPGPVAAFFRSYPQILWLGFILGAWLYLAFSSRSLSTTRPNAAQAQPHVLEVAGRSLVLPAWVGRAWGLVGVAALALILVVAAQLRIGDAHVLGATDLIRTDYDEGVHASAALLLAQGKTVYRDFFLTQPPVGPLVWSLPLRFGHAEWGGLTDFLRLRLFTSLLSLGTIALVYIIGRKLGGRWAGPMAGGISALVLAVDGGAIRTEQQIMLEPIVNFFTAAAIAVFVQIEPVTRSAGVGSKSKETAGGPGSAGEEVANAAAKSPEVADRNRFQQFGLPVAAGVFAGLALSVKIPALAVVVGLGLSLLIWRQWRSLGLYTLGVVGGYLSTTAAFLLSAGPSFIKQAYLYQLLRPFNTISLTGSFQAETTLTAFDYLTRTPYLALTLLGSVAGLVAIVAGWLTRKVGGAWLPITLVAVLTALLYTGKAGFFPHYYDHLALPLALLAGGVVNFWPVAVWRSWPGLVMGALGVLGLALVLGPSLSRAGDEPSKPQWSAERAVDNTFERLDLADGSVLTWDARYSFMLGLPMPLDNYNKYLVDSAAYVEYLGLDLGGQNLVAATQKALFNKSAGDMRQLRYTALVQGDLLKAAEKSDYVLIEPRAESQLTQQSTAQLKSEFVNRLDAPDIDIYSNGRAIQHKTEVTFGEGMRLVGYETVEGKDTDLNLEPGAKKLPLTLFWRGDKPIGEDYVIFIHLLNEAGETVAQRDTAPRYGQFDTSKWIPGELLDDDQSLEIATNLSPGRYKLEIGVYRPGDGQRLGITGASDNIVTSDGNSLILFEVNVLGL